MTKKFELETEENPKMLQVYLQAAWHEVFCYSLAFEEQERHEDKLLFAIISGSDSALQSVRGAIDIGSRGGIKFGYGTKELTQYTFSNEKSLFAEKGKYEKFPMTLNQNRKALAIVHEDVLNNSKYILSFDANPAKDIAQLLGGSSYGLHILPEWEQVVFEELVNLSFLVKHELYKDEMMFPDGLNLYSINLDEHQADQFIGDLIREKKIEFPRQGNGDNLTEVNNLTDYLMGYNEHMVEKLSETVSPTHNPIIHDTLEHFSTYPRELFPVQSHTATAVIKRLQQQKAVIIQGEMSTGKSSMMTAIVDGFYNKKNKQGYFSCLMCPPNLTRKWPDEIKVLIPHASVHVISKTSELIRFHQEWVAQGKPKPTVPTFFVISFTTMRGDCRTVPSVKHLYRTTSKRVKEGEEPYRNGFYCSSCGKAHQTITDSAIEVTEEGVEIAHNETHNMTSLEFGESRRIKSSVKPANAFCYYCGESLWTKIVPVRYSNFSEWASHEKKVIHAVSKQNDDLLEHVQASQKNRPTQKGMPYKVSAIEYIRRKMKNFFDLTIVDELHELKGGMTAQGNALGSLVGASKKVVAGTGTLFGGKAEDIYYLLWRLFPYDMVSSGYQYEEVSRFNEEYGNVEETTYQQKSDSQEYSNTNSRGGDRRTTKKVLPGISPFIYGRYMVQNIINVRLKDVWPDPVDLVDTPTIFVPMSEELTENYRAMISAFEDKIDSDKKAAYKLFMPMTDYGIAYPDNPFTFPTATFKNEDGEQEVVWEALHLSENCTLPKEKKLQEIISGEISEGRKSIVYVRDTGSSVSARDIRPRLKKKLEEIGAKVCILDTTTTATNSRSEWLLEKMENEDYDVCIVSQELVKVGLDLLCTPTLIYYQFSWSLFTINQSSRRAWRIGQSQECRLFYLAYQDTFQEKMATLIAMKNRATSAINGEVSSDGLSAMLGDDGDLQSMLIQSVKKGGTVLKGSAEDWISQTSDRARELLANIGKKKEAPTLLKQFEKWLTIEIKDSLVLAKLKDHATQIVADIELGELPGFVVKGQAKVLEVDFVAAFGMERTFITDTALLNYLIKPTIEHSVVKQTIETLIVTSTEDNRKEDKSEIKIVNFTDIDDSVKKQIKRKRGKGKLPDKDQLTFDLFG